MALDGYYMLYFVIFHIFHRNAHESSHASLWGHTNDAKYDAWSCPNAYDATYAMYGFLYQPLPKYLTNTPEVSTFMV